MRSRIPRIAAACIVAAGLLALVLFLSSGSGSQLAFAEVLENVRQTRSLTCTITNSTADPEMSSRIWIRRPDNFRADSDRMFGDEILIMDRRTGKGVIMNILTREATVMHGLDRFPWDAYAFFEDARHSTERSFGERIIDGRRAVGFKVMKTMDFGIGGVSNELATELTVWADAESGLPLRVEMPDPRNEQVVLYTDIRYDVELDDALFDMTIPEGYTVQDIGDVSEE